MVSHIGCANDGFCSKAIEYLYTLLHYCKNLLRECLVDSEFRFDSIMMDVVCILRFSWNFIYVAGVRAVILPTNVMLGRADKIL
jgi:hypothetical protein